VKNASVWNLIVLNSSVFMSLQVYTLKVLDCDHNFLPLSLGHSDRCLYHFSCGINGNVHNKIVSSICSFQVAKNFIFTLESIVIQDLQTGRTKSDILCHGSGAGVSFGLQPTWNVVGRRKLLASEPQSSHIATVHHSARRLY
jgi:hypothetical protein